jgi:DNA-binding PadR family transcriptional regulator
VVRTLRYVDAAYRSSALALTVLALLHYKPLHPYGVQRLIKEWGKDQVVKVGQRAGVYRTIERLQADGLITVKETGRDQAYPERTVYEITDTGRTVARSWLLDMLSTPKQEFPQFPAALSHLLMLTSAEIQDALGQRLHTLTEALIEIDGNLADQTGRDLPRVSLLEFEYLRTITAAEVQWLQSVLADLRAGRLNWSPEMLAAFDDAAE